VEIRYNHIPPILLQPTARVRAVGPDMQTRGKRVGYLPGAGDSIAGALEQMGYEVKMLTGADLAVDGLRGLDAVVVGVRAFNVRDDLASHMPELFDFVKAGGTVVAQYGEGYFVYTGLVFFRELSAGVPGAYRLFANLVSLGRK
jgi:hypothetical protein